MKQWIRLLCLSLLTTVTGMVFAQNVAKIGDVGYTTLQAALDAAHEMTGDVTVTLLDDISGYSIVHQKANLNLTIEGDDKTVSGQIIIDGDGRLSDTETLSIQNINFEGSPTNFYSGTDAFILVPSTKTTGTPYYTNKYNYAHNVTVDNCSFTSTSASFNVVAVKANSNAGLRNIVITNNMGTNLHSLAQLTGTEDGNISKNTVGNSDSFVNISGGKGDFTISENTFTSASTDGYAVRENANSTAVLTLTKNNFTAPKAVQLGKNASATNGTINVVSGTYVGDIGKDISASATGKIVLTGGQFSAPVGDSNYEEFIAEGYMGMNDLYNSETAPNGVIPSDVAVMWTKSNGTVQFFTATQAMTTTSLFTGDGTYKLLNNFTRSSRMSTGIMVSAFTLDLNGYTLTSTAADEAILLSRAGTASAPKTCAIIDSSEDKGGKLVVNTAAEHAILINGKYNEVTIGEGVTIDGNCVSLLSANQKLTVEGTINGGNDFAIATNGSNTTDATINIKNGAVITSNTVAVYLPGTGTTTIEEGSSITGATGVYIKSGTLNITGGEITGNGAEAAFTHNDNGVNSTGDALVVENCSYPGGVPVVNVTGGIFTSTNSVAITSYAYGDGNEPVAHFVNGGYFSTELAEEVCPVGMRTVASSTMAGYYELAEANYVAQIGETKYETLAEAIAAVPVDGTETTIVMIADAPITGNNGATIPAGKNVKLDLNGKSITLNVAEEKASQLITNRGTLTIIDSSDEQTGVLTNAASEGLDVGSWPSNNYVTCVINNNGTLNVESGNIVSTANGSICYAVDNNNTSYDAILNINGGRLTSVGTVVRQFCNSTTKQNILNITGGVVETNGYTALWTQLPGSSSSSKKLATLNISGGEIKGGTYAWYDYTYGDSFEAVDYSISGGKLTGYIYSYAVAQYGVHPGFITGGLFSIEPWDGYIGLTGYMFGPYEEDPSWYTLVPAEIEYSYVYNNQEYKEYMAFATPFVEEYICDGEAIKLLKDVTLTSNIACQLTEGAFTLTLGNYSLTAGNYSLSLKPGVTVNTDKQVTLFSSAEEGYVVVETAVDGGYSYTLVNPTEGIVELIDGEPYPYPQGKECTTVNYTRTFKDSQVDKCQAWFVPFNYIVTADDAENFTFYKIHMIAAAAEAGEVSDVELVNIYITPCAAGTKLSANRPYVVKPKAALTNHVFVAEDVEQVYAENSSSRLHEETTQFNYDFYGTYNTLQATKNHDWLAMNGGQICWNSSASAKLGSYRWYVKVTPRTENDDYSNLHFVFVETGEADGIPTYAIEGEDAIEGIYTSTGMKVESPVRGINIIRFKNGQTKKVYIK